MIVCIFSSNGKIIRKFLVICTLELSVASFSVYLRYISYIDIIGVNPGACIIPLLKYYNCCNHKQKVINR